MFDLNLLNSSWWYTPLGLSLIVGLIILLYVSLISINVYLPSVVLISLCVGYLTYRSQQNYCIQNSIAKQSLTVS